MRELLVIFCAVAVIAVLEAVRQIVRLAQERRKEELQRRLHAIRDDVGSGSTLLRQGRFAASPGLDAFLRGIPFAVRLEKLLEQADSKATVAQIIGWSGLAACSGVVASQLLGLGWAVSPLLALFGLAVPVALLLVARQRRSLKVSEQLPDALDMMARSLRAGHALTAAFEVVATEMPEPVAVEFGRAFESQRLGLSVDQAIVQMTERVPGNRDLRIFAVSVVIQRETGGNLAEILGNISETIRARYRFYGKLRALTAEGRASAFVLGALPFVITGVLQFVNPKYLVPLVATVLGNAIAAGGFVLWLVGIVWMYRLTKVDI